MRNFLLLLAVTASVALSVSNVAAQTYCAPPAVNLYTTGCTDPDNIESFSTTGGSTNITNNNTGCSTPSTAYTYFSSMTHTAVQGTTVNFSFTNGASFTEYYKIWVDFNANGTLDDAGELVYTNSAKIGTSQTVTGSFTIPMSTVPGTKRIRVRCVYSNNTFTPCSEETWGEVEDYNLQVIASTPCSGTPTAGNAQSSVTNILCPGQNFTLSLSGSSLTSGLTYQWESSTDNITFTPIAGATNFNYTTTQAAPVMYYRAVVTCSNPGGGSATSTSVQVTNGSGPTYAPLPYLESFENTWMNTCNTREIPNNSWRNTPGTGNNSWRRNDDGAAAAWTTPATGAYTPAASDGSFSARFHSNNAPAASTGQFDLHLNCATAAVNKRVQYDFINTNGTDSLAIYLSTDGGSTFSRLDSARNSATWTKKSVVFSSNSATTIVRFIAYSDDGTSDIGIDNIRATDFDNCSGVPVAGTASNNAPANVCAGVPFTLTVTGQTDANLLTYQWEASTDGGATWTAIPGATTETYVTSQNTTTIYRLRITCTNGGGTAVSTTTTVTSPPIPNGVYTINQGAATTWPTGTNFNSFNAAYAAMSCGIGGPVTFNVVAGSGPYNEQLIMAPVRNTNATNTVTFNGNGETITFATTATERAVIKLNGAGFIRFENLVVVPTATSNAYGFQLSNDADSNIIRNNTINLSLTSTSNTLAGIVISGSNEPTGTGTTSALHDFNQILNNTINGGYYGITLTATPAGGANGNNTIRGNFVKDFYQYGIYVAGSYNTIIDSNFISRPTRATEGNFEGIYFNTQSNLSVVSRNRISNPFGGLASPTATLTFNGINFNSASASAGNDNTIVNNVVLCVNNTNAVVNGFSNTNSTSVSYFHNTIVLDEATSTATGATRGINIAGTADGILTYNNLVVITRGGSGPKHGIYLASGLLLGSDYNDVYVNATNAHWGFYQVNRTTLANWQSGTAAASLDVNSYQANPVLMNLAGCGAASVCIANAGMDNKGLYIGVDVDAVGNARDVNNPDIGAFECTPPPCTIPPVTGTTVVTPTTICQGLPVALNLNIGAYGAGQTFQWQWSDDNITWVDMGMPMLTPDTTILADSTVWLR
ncbi:MAG TPA: GEVED domain-containing protein, partial [Chitinophagaceae bacterium]